MPAFRLLAVSADMAGHERHLDSPMVGRAKELVAARARARACGHRANVAPVHADRSRRRRQVAARRRVPAGLGRRARRSCAAAASPTARASRSSRSPRWSIEAAAILDGDLPAVARSKLDAVLAGAPDAERVAGLVAGLFGWAEPGADRGRLLGRAQAPRAPRPRAPGRRRVRRHPLGRADVPRPDRAPRRLDARRRAPARCASRGPSCSRSARAGAAAR